MSVEVLHITVDGKEIDEKTDIDKSKVKTDPKKVLELFESGKPMFVEFYANWCGHCKTLAPEWNKLITTIKDKDIAIVSIESKVVDKNIDKVLEDSGLVEVKGFPTIGLIKNKVWFPYEGGRKMSFMLEFIEKELSGMKGGARRRHRSIKRGKTTKRKTTKRKSTKRKSTKRKSTKRKSIRRRKY